MFGVDDAIIAAGITAAASAYGGYAANSARSSSVNASNDAAYQIAHADRLDAQFQYRDTQQFQERMANSAYQRGIADMRAAGLNPILAYKQGGATAPTGGGPVRSGAVPMQVPSVENVLGPAVSGAVQAAQVFQGLEATQQQITQSRAQTQLLESETNRSNQEAARIVAETTRSGEQSELTRRMQATELERQRQIAADAGLASARTVTERERAEQERMETQRFRNYGPRGPIPDAAASAEAVGRRAEVRDAARAAGAATGRALRDGQDLGSRLPSLPVLPRASDAEMDRVNQSWRSLIERLR